MIFGFLVLSVFLLKMITHGLAQTGTTKRVAVIGGGIAGISAARELKRNGIKAVVYDTGTREVGGRCSSRIVKEKDREYVIDHSAQFISAKSEEFRDEMRSMQVSLSLSLRFKGLLLFTDILVVSCFMWSGAIDSSGVLLLYHITSLASHKAIILISTLKHPYLYAVMQRAGAAKRMNLGVGSIDMASSSQGITHTHTIRAGSGSKGEESGDEGDGEGEGERWVGSYGMQDISRQLSSELAPADIRTPKWISKLRRASASASTETTGQSTEQGQGQGKYELFNYQKSEGLFDAVIIAHNGKCADRLLDNCSPKAPSIHRLLRVKFGPSILTGTYVAARCMNGRLSCPKKGFNIWCFSMTLYSVSHHEL